MSLTHGCWWESVDAVALESLAATWIPVGLPGWAGPGKARRRTTLDTRFGPDGWRISHFVRGRFVPFAEAILEYEASYRRFLRDRPDLVRFLALACGNAYDWSVENVHDNDYEQPATEANHYQDVAVRRVMAELVGDPTFPEVVSTDTSMADLVDLGTGKVHRVPRARGFGGPGLLQIRDPLSPGFCLNPAVIPVHDPELVTSLPGRAEWYHREGCAHLSVEAFWQMSKVVEVRYDRWLASGEVRSDPLAGL
jgi:hypothetical protein